MFANQLSLPRYSFLARVVTNTMLMGSAVFLGAMTVLVSHDSALECQSLTSCHHVETYPFGIVKTSNLSPVQRADVRWSPGSRSAALKLVLRHTDGTSSEYQGVGKNGDRAEDTADAINAYLAGQAGTKSFALREGSLPVAGFLAALGLLALVLAPHYFMQVRLQREGRGFVLTVGRWPAPTRRVEVPGGQPVTVTFEQRVVNGQDFYSLWLVVDDAQRIELGIATQSHAEAQRQQDVIAAFLRG